MIKIVTDSSSDLPKEIIKQYDITIVPLTVTIEGQDYLETINITPEEFFHRTSQVEELPKTSQPSPAAFAEVFSESEGNSEILCLTISSGLSGTYQSACLGKELADNTKVTVFDTLAGSLGHGLQIIRAAQLAEKGHSLEEIITDITNYRENMNILIMLNTLENIVKGGRLSKFKGTLAKVLSIKVILERIQGGKVGIFEKIRGKKKFQRRILEIMKERGVDFSQKTIGITHTGNLEDVESIKQEMIEQLQPNGIIVNYMGATMGTYAGKDGMIISF
jgi:DegV family protein with EDD domain